MRRVRTYGGISAVDRIAGRRERLLDAGLECFGSDGVAATGVKDVCRTAGLTDRYFYESFRDGRALFLAVFDGVTDALFARVAEATLAAGPHAEDQLRASIGTFLHALADDPRRARVVFAEAAAAGPEAAEHMNATLRRFAALVETYLPVGAPPIVALSLVGTLERVVVEWQAGELDLGVDALTEQCVGLYLRILSA